LIPVEIISARLERDGSLSADDFTGVVATHNELLDAWHEIVPTDAVRRTAQRLLRVHAHHAPDSLQLAQR
jgi:hypothetical protein